MTAGFAGIPGPSDTFYGSSEGRPDFYLTHTQSLRVFGFQTSEGRRTVKFRFRELGLIACENAMN
jgi:hypothetical protein